MAMVGRSRMFINENQMKLMDEFYAESAAVQLCRNRVIESLFSGGVRCVRRGVAASKDFDYILQRYWAPFLSDLYDCHMKWGLCVWSTRTVQVHLPSHRFSKKNKTTGDPMITRKVEVPYVRPFGSYRIEVRFTEKAEVSYHMYSVTKHIMASSEEEDKTMRISVLPRFKPTLDAQIRSPLMPMVARHIWLQDMRRHAMAIERTQARPPFICEAQQEKRNMTDAVAIEMFGDAECMDADQERTYARNRTNMNQLNRQRNMCSVLNGHHPKDRSLQIDPFTGVVTKKVKRKEVWEDSVFLLPEGQKMVTPLNPRPRTDLIELETQFTEMICGIIGVPRSLMMHDRGSSSVNKTSSSNQSDMNYRMFMRNLDCIGNTLIMCAEDVYTDIYGDKAQFSFPYLPVIDVDQIVVLAEMGVISRQTLGKHLLAAVGIPPEELQLQSQQQRDLMTLPEHARPEPAASKASK